MISSYAYACGASISISAPEKALANGQLLTVQIFLDAESDVLSGVSGDFSFDTDLFSLDSITTDSSVVSLWIKQPSLSEEKYLDARTHISFEGIFPGGYSGVRSAYYQGVRPGTMFTLTLIPKKGGRGTFLVDDIVLNAYNSEATPIPTTPSIQTIIVPELDKKPLLAKHILQEVTSPTLSTLVTRDPLINNNAWYLIVNEQEAHGAIDTLFVAETGDPESSDVEEQLWRSVTNPYVLTYQNRTKYIHIKIHYSDNTYTTRTLPPVENFESIPVLSRILVLVVLLLLAVSVLHIHAKNLFKNFKKNTGDR